MAKSMLQQRKELQAAAQAARQLARFMTETRQLVQQGIDFVSEDVGADGSNVVEMVGGRIRITGPDAKEIRAAIC